MFHDTEIMRYKKRNYMRMIRYSKNTAQKYYKKSMGGVNLG